jgi:TonB family protein
LSVAKPPDPLLAVDPLLERLHAAENATTLTREGVNPFYLKIDVHLYDAKGQPSEQGTIEEWWAGDSTEKTVFTTPSYTATHIRKGDEIFRTAGVSYPPNLLTALLNQVIHPISSRSDIDHSKATMRPTKFGTVPIDCIALQLHNDPNGIPQEYCFDPGKDSLRLTFQYGARLIIRNGIGHFQQQEVPMDVAIRIGNTMAATGHISALMSRPVSASEISTVGLTQRIILSSPLATSATIITRPEPIYPELAKIQHLSGVVALQAFIGTDGHIHELQLLSSPSAVLTEAAEDAVKRWTYTPYLVNGEPEEVQTTISVHFRFGP